MRIKLLLRPVKGKSAIPLNYQYPLSAAIYKILNQASPEYAHFLHDHGYPAPSGRLMKLFTFSKLWIPGVQLRENFLVVSNQPCTLFIGSPMLEEFVQNFVIGLFETSKISLFGRGTEAHFQIEQVETLPTPKFQERMRFKCLSPITVSTATEKNGRLQIYYYRPHDEGLPEALRQNLLQKHEIIHGNQPENSALQFRLEQQDKPKSKLITIKEGTPQATRIKAFETYFTMEGSPELMQEAWECGLGEHNSQGFGMVEVVVRRAKSPSTKQDRLQAWSE